MGGQNPFTKYTITAFFHFTDRRNVSKIRELGGLYSLAKLREMNVEVPAPGGNDWSHEADEYRGLDQYIHLCFRDNHPMEYLARKEGRIKDSVFLHIHPQILEVNGVKFTADVSNKSGVAIYSIEESKSIIDFEVLYTRTDWKDLQIQQRLKQAEKMKFLCRTTFRLNL
jgi:hypothetical protein